MDKIGCLERWFKKKKKIYVSLIPYLLSSNCTYLVWTVSLPRNFCEQRTVCGVIKAKKFPKFKNSCPILNPFNIREKIEIGEEKTSCPPKFKLRMPRRSCRKNLRNSVKSKLLRRKLHGI